MQAHTAHGRKLAHTPRCTRRAEAGPALHARPWRKDDEVATSTKVGLFLTNQQPLGRDMVQALDEQIAMLHAARDGGWDSVWTGQHYLPGAMSQLQPVPFLARLAAEAGQMTVGLGVQLLALQNPVAVAEEMASLDVITRGRFVYGVGLGYRDVEYDAFGVPDGTRLVRFERNLDIVTRLWAGEPVTVDLPWCRLDEAQLTLRPVQQPRPPLWFAANNDKAVRRAARLGDTWLINPHARTDTIRRQLELFGKEREDHGLPPVTELPAIKEVFCAESREQALEMAGPHLAEKYKAYAAWGQDKALPGNESFRVAFDELEESRFVLGSPDECLEQLLPWRDELGVNHFVVRTHWSGMPVEASLHSIRLLTDEVLPVLRSA